MSGIRSAAAWIAGPVLGAIGALHVLWAFAPWPFEDDAALAKTVLGNKDGELTVTPAASVGMGLVLIGAGVLTLMVYGAIRAIGPAVLRKLAICALALGLLARGLGGFAMNSGQAEEFQDWNTALYSPLCVLLGALVTLVALPLIRPARPEGAAPAAP
ncbi:DUF3995 domain-containing protein [Streptomyces palmae]|uniref:DUF3995 domain-containing protein n=1 Tax=Streptomyces palmae TaxID=1701085 RepID=A0A4Z0FN97_9ACTN|nr:DUF3995 domain-containing protein [Streptomyces palmae]TGA83254.1 DUF3995 domain-containing protein [Streptomyces palmae]